MTFSFALPGPTSTALLFIGPSKEKRLMIDIKALRQSYERRELHEVRWIHGDDNPADAFTKGTWSFHTQHRQEKFLSCI
jgi:hypothetical protein